MIRSNRNLVFKQMTILTLNGMGVTGLLLIGYAVLSSWTTSTWPVLEQVATHVGTILTLVGTALVACSAYFPPHLRKADAHSRLVMAPFTLLLVGITFGHWVVTKRFPSVHVVNGFAIMALAASILRALPFSEWQRWESANGSCSGGSSAQEVSHS